MKRTIRLTESELKHIINESVRKIINEEFYPEDDDMMDDYYYGMMVKCEIEGNFEDLTEEQKQALINTNEEYCEGERSYVSTMVTKVDVQEDEYGDYDITVNAAVSAPEMPIRAIEEEVIDELWFWFEEKTGLRAIDIKIVDEQEVFDRRTEKYK